MLKKNSTKNIQIVSTRIINTNKLPKDFFPSIVRPSRSLDIRKKSCENSEIMKSSQDSQHNGLLFTFNRSRSSNLRLRPLNEVQHSKPSKQRQSCPITLNYEQIWSKEDKQNRVIQKKGRNMYKITRKTLTLDSKHKIGLKLESLKY